MAAFLGLGITVLLMQNDEDGLIHRVALSETEQAEGSTKRSVKRFEDIKIPVDDKENIVAQAIALHKYRQTDDWQYLFVPELNLEEAKLNQASAGIACSFVYPLTGSLKGALIFSYFINTKDITIEHKQFMEQYTQMVSDKLSTLAS